MNLDKYVGARLRRLRQDNQLDRRRLAEILGTDRDTYAAYEVGAQAISARVLFELACHFDVQVTYFFEGFEGVSANGPVPLPDSLRPKR